MDEKIQTVKNNKEKAANYQIIMIKYKIAMKSNFYAEAEMIVYAFLEDRLRSLLYYLGAIKYWNSQWLTDDAAMIVGQVTNLKDISIKAEKIQLLLKRFKNTSKQFNKIIKYIKQVLTIDQIKEIIEIIKSIDKWRDFRNEITHALFNKDLLEVNHCFKDHVEQGFKLGRGVDKYIKIIKNKRKIINF